jgi:hypothetical protein
VRSTRVLVSFLAVAALGSGCGSSYHGLTKAEFIKRATAICAKSDKANDAALRKALAKDPSPSEIAKVFSGTVVPLINKELDELAALEPPKADRDRVKEMIAELRNETKTLATRLETDPAKVLNSKEDPYEKSHAAFKAYGLTRCGG